MNLDAPVSTIMTSSLECVSPDQKIIDIKHIYEQAEFHSHIPVIDDGKIVGIVSIVNFMRAIHNATLDDNEEVYNEINVKKIMTPRPSTVKPETSIREVITLLSSGNFHSVLIAENKELKGIITTTDILKLILQ